MMSWFMLVSLVLGDSHAEGHPGEYLARVLRSRGHETTVVSKVGLRAPVMARYPFVLEDAYTVILLGTNDTPNRATERAYASLAKTYPKAFLVGPPKFRGALGARMTRVSKIQRRIFKSRWIDSRPCTEDFAGRAKDGVHFTALGAKKWVDCIMLEIDRRTP